MFNLSSNFQEKPKGKQKGKGWRLFQAKDFQTLMYPCFTFCRILGIFPYKINASTFVASKLYYTLWTVVIGVSYGINALAYILHGSSIFGKIDMKILPRTLGSICVFVFGGFIMVVTFILSGPRMRLLQILLNISSRLPAESYQKLSRLIHAKDVIGFICLIENMFIRMLKLRVNSMFHTYIILVVFQMDMLYINCVCVLKACFKRINDNLAHMRELIINDNSHGSRLTYEQRNPFLIMELKALKRQHMTISDTVHKLNMIFSLQLLATVVMTFSDVTITLYYYVLDWQHIPLMSTSMKALSHTYYLSRLMYYGVKMGLVTWACETGKNQALQITISIHDISNNITDKQIKDELQLFSLQTLHCENTFSAKGLTVDAKLLAAIVGSIIMYVLILFQFMHMSYSCERKIATNITEVI
ncbi:PREDICTED: uncharacterized protein LOC105557294 [Vollenhovia emeryi]|uniref:uncharacterized protein LOC105557294 n=1 Tax=Vollenhovia emeryi TaxID=411798 RepID=UPI0005F49DBA|nr:PREDICTED: uncharacterized protein LOC105557294 [Vollenhovia emeryi]